MERVLFNGAYGVVITPFKENGHVDFEALEKQADRVCRSGIEGLVVCGSTGEFTYLSDKEKKQMILKLLEINKGRKKIVCGATSANCLDTKRMMDFLSSVAVDGILTAPPYYFKMSDEDVLDFYSEISGGWTGSPLIAYQIPQCTSRISLEVFKRLLMFEAICGIKNSSGNCIEMMHEIAIKKQYREKFSILTGSDESIYGMINSGADGSFTALAYIYPELIEALYVHMNDKKGAEIQMQITRLAALAAQMPFPLGYKIIGEARGDINFGTYLQAVSKERMVKFRTMQENLAAHLLNIQKTRRDRCGGEESQSFRKCN